MKEEPVERFDVVSSIQNAVSLNFPSLGFVAGSGQVSGHFPGQQLHQQQQQQDPRFLRSVAMSHDLEHAMLSSGQMMPSGHSQPNMSGGSQQLLPGVTTVLTVAPSVMTSSMSSIMTPVVAAGSCPLPTNMSTQQQNYAMPYISDYQRYLGPPMGSATLPVDQYTMNFSGNPAMAGHLMPSQSAPLPSLTTEMTNGFHVGGKRKKPPNITIPNSNFDTVPSPKRSPGSFSMLDDRESRALFPRHFYKGAVIRLGNDTTKLVEDLTTDDFVRSANNSDLLQMDTSTVRTISLKGDNVSLAIFVNSRNVLFEVEAPVEHPFFVFDLGWASCHPTRTEKRYGLLAHRLEVGHKFILLTKRRSPPSADLYRPQSVPATA